MLFTSQQPDVSIPSKTFGDAHGRVLKMNLDEATELLRHTLVLTMVISAPILLVGLGVGLIISIVQAVTQIQEQTLAFVPKIAAMVAVTILLMPWISNRLIEYTEALLSMGSLP